MKLAQKHIGKLVTFTDEDFDGYDSEPYEFYLIPVTTPNWYEYIDLNNVGWNKWKDVVRCVSPLPTLGLVVEIGQLIPNVQLNYAKVLFPKMVYHDPDNNYLAYPVHDEVPAGAYWISGDMLKLVEE